jgi:hypothetical protein
MLFYKVSRKNAIKLVVPALSCPEYISGLFQDYFRVTYLYAWFFIQQGTRTFTQTQHIILVPTRGI